MLSGNDYTFASCVPVVSTVGLKLKRIPLDDTWPVAPQVDEQRVLQDWLPQLRDPRQRLQAEIDAEEAQLLLLDRDGTIALVNRSWRLSADLQQLTHAEHGIGLNYLSLCHAAAAQGCCDAARTAEGIDAVVGGLWRSFTYKYAWTCEHERRLYLLRAWRLFDETTPYTAVSHQLLESRSITAAERSCFERVGTTIES